MICILGFGGKGIDDKVVIEVFLEGREFTAIVLDTGLASECNPITLLPTEVNHMYQIFKSRISPNLIFYYAICIYTL